ncbi:hypothetical protein SAMN05216203_1258 [Marinobacter daqiaonensis]|uniref:DKNYY family protein n=1 Tax=Marinobacter daqiaonensis TaxID=650891 RepID=A0A1I6HHU2_9GAMM|nr:hypothetical protein [Marinobacter daqiaonensis]SFR54053.1 hypothetical protein SAMN05216203_1258 [Marinobacter daqiaonensis]
MILLSKRRHVSFRNLLLLTLAAMALVGCASYNPPAPLTSAGCTTSWVDVGQRLDQAGIRDAQGTEIPGYPYLRVNRTLMDFDLDTLTPEQKREWLEHALDNGERALRARLKRLDSHHGFDPAWLMHCARQQVDALVSDSDQWQSLAAWAHQPDAYLDWRRVVGAYPLVRPILAYQVRQLQEEQAELFGTPVDGPEARLFAPALPASDPAEAEAILGREGAWGPLGLPSLTPQETARLLARHAPYLMMASGERYDQPGTPFWKNGEWRIEPPARAYTLLSQVRWQDQWLPQLVYVFWFDKRPKPHPLDLYGGRLDGLIWRVTLDHDGEVVLYESVHPCGCYLQWYPNPDRLQLNPDAVGDEIMTVLPLEPPSGDADEARPTIHLESGTHYVSDVRFGSAPEPGKAATSYGMVHYDRLRALPDGTGKHRSLFLPNGLVPGTARLERFLLWNTGVLSPGGMRQWGHHATAFIGKRHFDDPDLLNRYFNPAP